MNWTFKSTFNGLGLHQTFLPSPGSGCDRKYHGGLGQYWRNIVAPHWPAESLHEGARRGRVEFQTLWGPPVLPLCTTLSSPLKSSTMWSSIFEKCNSIMSLPDLSTMLCRNFPICLSITWVHIQTTTLVWNQWRRTWIFEANIYLCRSKKLNIASSR